MKTNLVMALLFASVLVACAATPTAPPELPSTPAPTDLPAFETATPQPPTPTPSPEPTLGAILSAAFADLGSGSLERADSTIPAPPSLRFDCDEGRCYVGVPAGVEHIRLEFELQGPSDLELQLDSAPIPVIEPSDAENTTMAEFAVRHGDALRVRASPNPERNQPSLLTLASPVGGAYLPTSVTFHGQEEFPGQNLAAALTIDDNQLALHVDAGSHAGPVDVYVSEDEQLVPLQPIDVAGGLYTYNPDPNKHKSGTELTLTLALSDQDGYLLGATHHTLAVPYPEVNIKPGIGARSCPSKACHYVPSIDVSRAAALLARAGGRDTAWYMIADDVWIDGTKAGVATDLWHLLEEAEYVIPTLTPSPTPTPYVPPPTRLPPMPPLGDPDGDGYLTSWEKAWGTNPKKFTSFRDLKNLPGVVSGVLHIREPYNVRDMNSTMYQQVSNIKEEWLQDREGPFKTLTADFVLFPFVSRKVARYVESQRYPYKTSPHLAPFTQPQQISDTSDELHRIIQNLVRNARTLGEVSREIQRWNQRNLTENPEWTGPISYRDICAIRSSEMIRLRMTRWSTTVAVLGASEHREAGLATAFLPAYDVTDIDKPHHEEHLARPLRVGNGHPQTGIWTPQYGWLVWDFQCGYGCARQPPYYVGQVITQVVPDISALNMTPWWNMGDGTPPFPDWLYYSDNVSAPKNLMQYLQPFDY